MENAYYIGVKSELQNCIWNLIMFFKNTKHKNQMEIKIPKHEQMIVFVMIFMYTKACIFPLL